MADEKDHIKAMKEVKSRSKHITNVLKTHEASRELYENQALKEILAPKDDKGNPKDDQNAWNWHLLDRNNKDYKGDDVAEKIESLYLTDLKKMLKDEGEGMHPSTINRHLRGFYGVSKDKYSKLIYNSGMNFNNKENEDYQNMVNQTTRELLESLQNHTHEHLKVSHINDILAEIGADKYLIDAKDRKGIKRRENIPKIAQLVSKYDKEKGITIDAKDLEKSGFNTYMKNEYLPDKKDQVEKKDKK